ncbi:MAG: VanZ family protein [Gemmataceae bacterium]
MFLFFLALWTYELLAENPVPESVSRAIPNEWKFWLAKGLHVVGYAFLTVLAWLLPVPRLVYWLVIALLLLHGIATEVGQTFVAGRTGSVRDVLLDWVGVGLGLLVVWPLTRLSNRTGQRRRRIRTRVRMPG